MVMLRNAKAPEKTGPQNVVFYIRVSSDKQAKKQDGSLDTQLDLLTKFVEYRRSTGVEWVVSERFVEGESEGRRRGKSAKDTHRPTFQKMLASARAGLIDIIVFTKIDRISRNVVDFMLTVEELDKYGVRVVSLRENIDLTTPAGKFQTILMIALAQHEREVISERVREKVRWRAEKGLPLGRPPSGYVMKQKMFEIDEPYAAHVRAADAIYLEKQSTDVLVVEFRRLGYRTKGGGFYTKPMLCKMLRNPVYAAKQEYEGELFPALWKPIRSWETHEKIQALMDKNNHRKHGGKTQPRSYVYLLQGLLRCGACGHKMSPRPGQGRNGQAYPYYSCVAAEKTIGGSCPRRFVPAAPLDQAVLTFMKELHLKPDHIREIARLENESTSETLGKLRKDHERVQEQVGSVMQKLSHLTEILAQGGMAALGSVREKLESLEAERKDLEASEARLKAELEAEESQEIIAQDHVQTLGVFQEVLKDHLDQPGALKAILPRFIDFVVWTSGEKGEGRLEVALYPDPVALSPADLEFAAAGSLSPGHCFARESQMVRREGLEPTTR